MIGAPVMNEVLVIRIPQHEGDSSIQTGLVVNGQTTHQCVARFDVVNEFLEHLLVKLGVVICTSRWQPLGLSIYH